MSEVNSLILNNPDDLHVHPRGGSALETSAPFTARWFWYALIMPNKPPIFTAEDVRGYSREIDQAIQVPLPQGLNYEDQVNWGKGVFRPLMSIKLTPRTKVEDLRLSMLAGAIAGKLYPVGATTGSDVEKDIVITRPEDLDPYDGIFREMERLRMVLPIHGELPDFPDLERELAFLPALRYLAERYTELRIILEHVSSAEGAKLVQELGPNVAATITAHHLLLTYSDVLGHNHNFCRPVARYLSDREALIEAAISGNPKFFFGSDNAPHHKMYKECAEASAGIFTAPVALPLLAQVFEAANALDKLKEFLCVFGKKFYGLPIPKKPKRILLVKEAWTVPHEYDGIVPFMAGKKLEWQVKAA